VAHTGAISQSAVRYLLVILQVALSLIVLIGAGLFVRSLQKELSVDLGFQVGNVLLLSMDLERQGYTESRGKQFLWGSLSSACRSLLMQSSTSLLTYSYDLRVWLC